MVDAEMLRKSFVPPGSRGLLDAAAFRHYTIRTASES